MFTRMVPDAAGLVHQRVELRAGTGIASFEDGGLQRAFTAIPTCQCWDMPLLVGFPHFLVKYIAFDSRASCINPKTPDFLPPHGGIRRGGCKIGR